MTSGTLQDRRQFALEQLAVMASQNPTEHPTDLRRLAASVLGFTPVSHVTVAVDQDQHLPKVATVIGQLTNEFGPDYLAVYFDLSELQKADNHRFVTQAQVQAANDVVQRYAGDLCEPLLIFALPDGSGVHFATGDPAPENRYRLRDILRVTAYWNSSNRTALECLNQAGDAIAGGSVPRRAFRDAFSVQPVTEEFFKDYRAAYDAAVALLTGQLERQDAEQFTQTLFNRLLFVHFVSRKGWLKFHGDADYLNALWRDYHESTTEYNFYTARLTTLFFAGLNNPQSQNLSTGVQPLIGEVPFLNGGLFEETDLDRRAAHDVPDAALTPLLGDGNAPGLFNRYNFTVMEATPLDTEVAVDPEMLGKLFEETVNERHSNGAYYTPRPVVAFMCREAIKGYLAGQNIAGLDDAKISALVDDRNPDAITPQQALEVANVMSTMKAVDPACGSGAFLLGLLQEILALNDSLFRAGHTPESLYRQKLDIITNNIYGADKDALAVSTAMLRLWLSLAVDYDGDGPPDPLPNLDLKLVVGDAIAGPDPQQLDQTQYSIAGSGLRQDLAAYTTAHGTQKAALKQRVDDTKAQLRNLWQAAVPDGAVEWRIDFADVMLNGGFDVVIANPPYVRHEQITPRSYRDSLVKQYHAAAVRRSDLYCYFYARGIQLLRDGGMHVFVCSNSWLDVGYGAKLQEYLLNHTHVTAIYESALERQFATADINTVISVIRKPEIIADKEFTKFVSLRDKFGDALADPAKRREIVLNRAELRTAGTNGHRFIGDKWGGKYLRAPDIYHHILKEYGSRLARLGDVATVRYGIKTGANAFFYLTPERIDEFGIEAEYCRLAMTTPQESRRLAVDPATLPKRLFMCHADKNDLAGTGALAYIQWGEQQGYNTRSSTKSRPRWYDLGQRDTVQLAMNLLVDSTARTFLLTENVLFTHNFITFSSGKMPIVQLCVAMNSTLFQLVLNIASRSNFGQGVLEIQTYET